MFLKINGTDNKVHVPSIYHESKIKEANDNPLEHLSTPTSITQLTIPPVFTILRLLPSNLSERNYLANLRRSTPVRSAGRRPMTSQLTVPALVAQLAGLLGATSR